MSLRVALRPGEAAVTDPFEPLEESAVVACPYCGEILELRVDPGGGAHQEYVEDCQICCRPWQVTVRVERSGELSVRADTLDEG